MHAYLVQHGKAKSAEDDPNRGLSDEGREEVTRVAEFLAGMRILWVAGLGGVAAVGLGAAYLLIPHVARRIERFMDPASGEPDYNAFVNVEKL